MIGSYTKHEKVHFSHDNMSFVCVIKFRSHIITFMDHVIYLFVFLEIF